MLEDTDTLLSQPWPGNGPSHRSDGRRPAVGGPRSVAMEPRSPGPAKVQSRTCSRQSCFDLGLGVEARATAPIAGATVSHRPMVTTIDVM
jgi:hypothetical protein